MSKQELEKLLGKYFNGTASQSERQLVDDFYGKIQEDEPGWDSFTDERKKNIKHEVYNLILQKRRVSSRRKSTSKKSKQVWRVAASIIIVAGLSLTYFLSQPQVEPVYITKSTSEGQKATIELADGSRVRLNSKSSIRFPKTFFDNSREVELSGEAFFEVTEDEKRPFIVTAYSSQTTVLGTSFNVNAYDSLDISVALVDGSVNVKRVNEERSVNLIPGEIALCRQGEELLKNSFDQKMLTAWKDGIIYISNATHNTVFEQLSHWYGVEFRLTNQPAEAWNVSGEFKDMSLETVLNTIGFTKRFDYKIQENEVIIKFEN